MLRTSVTLALIFSLFTLSLATPAFAQGPPAKEEPVAQQQLKEPIDFRKFLSENAKRADTVDAKALEKISRQTPKKGLTGRQKGWIALAIIGAAALVFVLVKYGKECLRYEPADCNPNNENETCTCKEYKQNL